jgi:hypothetical protein
MDPPAIISAYGLHWFPVWKGSYVLCGLGWKAMGWMLEKTVQRSTNANRVPRAWIAGLVLAPQAAVEAAGWTLPLQTHALEWRAPIGTPETLTEAAAMHRIALDFRVHADALCWVIQDKTTVTLHRQIQLPGFHYLVHPSANASDPNNAILSQVYVDRNLPYSPAPPASFAAHIDWSAIPLPSAWKPKRRIRGTGNRITLISGMEGQDELFIDDPELTPPPTILRLLGTYDAASVQDSRSIITNAMDSFSDPYELALFSTAAKALALGASVRSNPLAMELTSGQYPREIVRERIEAYSDLDSLLAESTETDRKHMIDYVNL